MLAQRQVQPEVMDQRGLPLRDHARALTGLARLNAWSRSAELVWGPIAELAERRGLSRLSLLDVGCGGGDVPLACHHLAKSRGVGLDLTVLDRSATALAHASARAAAAQVPLRCVEADISAVDLPGPFDVVTCSLLLHHLPRPVAGELLAKMAAAARFLVVVQDLRRCAPGYAAAWLASRVVTRSKVVHHDGPVSVRAAFSADEAREMARDAGLNDVEVTTRFPWRWVLVWERPQAQG